MYLVRSVIAAALILSAVPAWSQEPAGAGAPMIVKKKTFELPSYTTEGGWTIKKVKIGWESYGTLNADKSNAILITHFFSGTSHAAGKYEASDPLPGYWDAIIGPGKAIDTNKYFVFSSDTLVNLTVGEPTVVTTGPDSTDPDTGNPYGPTFPVVSIKDFANVQKALVDSLGIKKLHAVMGASMGALQAYEWAVTYPEMVERIVPVVGAAGGDPFLIAWLDVWAQPIRLDPDWKGGNYYRHMRPYKGLAASLKVISLHANQEEWARNTFGLAPAVEDKKPGAAMDFEFKIVSTLNSAFDMTRVMHYDANHLLYLVKANQLAAADPSKIKAPTLLINAPTDLIFPQAWIDRTAAAIQSAGTPLERATVDGPNGHLNGVLHIAKVGKVIEAFLAKPVGK